MKITPVCWIPGKTKAMCLPPFGVFVEKSHIKDRVLIRHERGHWLQYLEQGLVKYYRTIISQYLKWGWIKAPVEADATRRGET